MSWDCPHLKKDVCVRVNKVCLPLQNGCVLKEWGVQRDDHLDKREETDSENSGN